ncbi:MAG: thioredoxin family protein [Longimicrobiales bacterium]
MMVLTPSTMIPLGSVLPDFALPDGTGAVFDVKDFQGADATLVAFWCNHCPFVKHLLEGFVKYANYYASQGVTVVAINSNDASTHPADSPEQMVREAKEWSFPFPYLVDETQDVAKGFQAACTPDFFLFDGDRRLAYRGQFDRSRPSNDVPVSGEDLRRATERVLAGEQPAEAQAPSIGCNIKWKR